MYVLKVNPITSAKWDGSKLPESGQTSGRSSSDEERNIRRVPTKTIEEADGEKEQ